MATDNRESWLNSAVDILRDGVFTPQGAELPVMRVSVGLPYARNQRDLLIQTFKGESTADGIPQVYLNPSVSKSDEALKLLFSACSSLCHRTMEFNIEMVSMISDVLGEYPQSALRLPDYNKQTTRMLKLACPACNYTLSGTIFWLSKGLPTCPCGTKMEQVERKKRKV